jgi:hypothetical protein
LRGSYSPDRKQAKHYRNPKEKQADKRVTGHKKKDQPWQQQRGDKQQPQKGIRLPFHALDSHKVDYRQIKGEDDLAPISSRWVPIGNPCTCALLLGRLVMHQAEESDDNQMNGDNEIQQTRENQDQNPRDQRHKR